jgi:Ca2+/Na+ antiporter
MIASCFLHGEDKVVTDSAIPLAVNADDPLLEAGLEEKTDTAVEEEEKEVPLFDFMEYPAFQCVAAPFSCLFGVTVPAPTESSTGFMLTLAFIVSALWIAAISFGLAYSGSAIGCVAGINSALIGITLVATATTLSGVFASSIVAKRGHGDMAMSNALGSNIFCIFIGLGFPWFWSVVVIDNKPFTVNSDTRDVILSAGAWLGGTLLVVMLMVAGKGFKMTPAIGGAMLLMYLAFVVYMVVLEIMDPS